MAALVPTIVDVPMDFTVIATSPKDMQAGQRSLILWAARKIQAIKAEIAQATQQLKLHQEKKWNTVGWKNEIAKKERRAEFYRKIKMALEAGYYIVPPFPIDLFAIRTTKVTPTTTVSRYRGSQDQKAMVLPAGHGRYVDVRPTEESYTETKKNREGKDHEVTYWEATEFRDVDFPFKLARAEIREATDKAMSLKIFDQFGVLPARRRRHADPIVCGQIRLPNQPSYGNKAITFFVAWWIDTRTL